MAGWFDKNLRFSLQIFLNPDYWIAGWFWERLRVFSQKFLRKLDRGLISIKFEDFFAKWSGKARSRPFIRPIRRPGTAGDVATLPGQGIGPPFVLRRLHCLWCCPCIGQCSVAVKINGVGWLQSLNWWVTAFDFCGCERLLLIMVPLILVIGCIWVAAILVHLGWISLSSQNTCLPA